MGKYYVQSGTLRTVVQAESGRKAAIWAVHQAMQQVLPLDQQPAEAAHEPASERPMAVLAGTVQVSERGFDRGDGNTRATLEVVTEWNQMVTTLDRLERMLYRESVPGEETALLPLGRD